jgi:hypothetical protein
VGHVSQCTYLFAKEGQSLGYEVIIFVPRSAPSNLKIDHEFRVSRTLPDTYESLLIEGVKFNYKLKLFVVVITKLFGRKYGSRLRSFVDRLAWFITYSRQCQTSFDQLQKIYHLTEFDRVVFPNADLLTVRAYLKFVTNGHLGAKPYLGLRFINVLENHRLPKLITSTILFKRISRSRRHMNINVAAETASYRGHILQYVSDVFVCEYPHDKSVKTRRRNSTNKLNKNFVVGVLGSARPDKGFTSLATYIPKIIAAFGSRVKVITQEGLKSWDFTYDQTLAELRTYEQVTILPGYLNSDEIEKNIDSCDVLLMPYDTVVYEYRSSAMLFEAADRKIPMIVPTRSGLGEVVRKFGIGATFTTGADLIPALESVLKVSSKNMDARFESYNTQRSKDFKRLITG